MRAFKVTTTGVVGRREDENGVLTLTATKTDYWPQDLAEEYAAFERQRGFMVSVEPAPEFTGPLITREEWAAALASYETAEV